MRIREFRRADIPRLREIHARQGYGFRFPETRDLFAKYTVTDDSGLIVGFAGAESTVQIYGIFDSSWGSPHQRMDAIIQLHEPIRKKLKHKGFKTAHVWVDPQFKKFGRRLMAMGWVKALWDSYWKGTDGEGSE